MCVCVCALAGSDVRWHVLCNVITRFSSSCENRTCVSVLWCSVLSEREWQTELHGTLDEILGGNFAL
jgi:hypothetical protein